MVLRIPLADFRFRIRGFHSLWLAFPKPFCYLSSHLLRSITPVDKSPGLGSFHFARHYFGNRIFSFSSSGYLDVSVPRVPPVWLFIHHTVTEVFSVRFPHSEICGSKDICSSPQLIAAYHVFHRLLVPRHPPCALISLTFSVFRLSVCNFRKKLRQFFPSFACSYLLPSVTGK